jgi:hypothetical protein
MSSPCLSAGGIHFLDLHVPTGELVRSYDWLTGWDDEDDVVILSLYQTPLGFPRPAWRRYEWGGCALYSGTVVSVHEIVRVPHATDRTIRHVEMSYYSVSCWSNFAVSATNRMVSFRQLGDNEASSSIHFHSPVHSFPSPATPSWLGVTLGITPSYRTPLLPETLLGLGTGFGH